MKQYSLLELLGTPALMLDLTDADLDKAIKDAEQVYFELIRLRSTLEGVRTVRRMTKEKEEQQK